MEMREVILWVHVLCGVAWIGTSASFVIAAAAIAGEEQERREFVARAAPGIGRLCAIIACVIPLTGLVNLAYVVRARAALPAEFTGILAAKIALFAAMVAALWVAQRGPRQRDAGGRAPSLYGVMAALGTIALALGLWLSGT
jgi:putative copper export protein